MEHRTTCSYSGCTRSTWRPEDGRYSGDGENCIFHSPLTDRKRKEFKEAWETFLANTFSDSRTITSLDCSGFIFPIQITLKNLIITGKANFPGTVFQKDASFEKTIFKKADFSKALFESDVYFGKSSFTRLAVFKHTKFSGRVSFDRSEFLLPAVFSHAHCTGPANFRKVKFTSTSFDHTEFLDDANFTSARFLNEANFSNVSFFGNAHFTNAHFDGKAIFDDARFSRFGFFSDINLSCTTISFGNHPQPYVRNRENGGRPPGDSVFLLSKLWDTFQKRHLKYKSAPILRLFL